MGIDPPRLEFFLDGPSATIRVSGMLKNEVGEEFDRVGKNSMNPQEEASIVRIKAGDFNPQTSTKTMPAYLKRAGHFGEPGSKH